MSAAPLPTLMLVPTGVGCEIGGYAGDAMPAARLLAAASGCLITHPNVMNGASLYWNDPRIHYVEGYGLDRLATAEWHLRPVRRQRIGLLLDAGIEPELAQRQIQVAQGCRASLGLDIGPVRSDCRTVCCDIAAVVCDTLFARSDARIQLEEFLR